MSVFSRLIVAGLAVAMMISLYEHPIAQPWDFIGHFLLGLVFGALLGSILGEGLYSRWKKAHPKICTSCGLLLKTYALTSPDGKVHGSYRQCPRWVSTWNSDPVNCHNPPSNKKPSIGPWSSYFSAPMPLPPGAVCFVHGAQVNLSCGGCLTYLQSRGVLDEDEVNHLLD